MSNCATANKPSVSLNNVIINCINWTSLPRNIKDLICSCDGTNFIGFQELVLYKNGCIFADAMIFFKDDMFYLQSIGFNNASNTQWSEHSNDFDVSSVKGGC